MQKKNVQQVNRDIALLAPFLVIKLTGALDECHELGYPLALFEGYRSVDRQEYLYQLGRSLPGKVITYARPGQSFHNMGLACDLVFKIDGKWVWDGQYDKIEQIMLKHGFSSLKFERCHFQITGGLTAKKAWEIAQNHGLLHLWSIVEGLVK